MMTKLTFYLLNSSGLVNSKHVFTGGVLWSQAKKSPCHVAWITESSWVGSYKSMFKDFTLMSYITKNRSKLWSMWLQRAETLWSHYCICFYSVIKSTDASGGLSLFSFEKILSLSKACQVHTDECLTSSFILLLELSTSNVWKAVTWTAMHFN